MWYDCGGGGGGGGGGDLTPTGKTSLIKALSHATNRNIVSIPLR